MFERRPSFRFTALGSGVSKSSRRSIWRIIMAIVATIVLVTVVVLLGIVVYRKFIAPKPQSPQHSQAAVPAVDTRARRALDGIHVDDVAPRPTYAIMIDNLPQARPQAGIADARLVIVEPVEAGITRFIGIFQTDQVLKRIGPVRSLRPYMIDWAAELKAILAHVGGSPEALTLVRQYRYEDLNEFARGSYFWRDSNHTAPHNVYTSTDLLMKAALDLNLGTHAGDLEPWNYVDPDPSVPVHTLAPGVTLKRTGGLAETVQWSFDPATQSYLRAESGKPTQDEGDTQVSAKNVLIQEVDAQVIDSELRLRVNDEGTGVLTVLTDGEVVTGTWSKVLKSDRIQLLDSLGQSIALTPGTTWVEVMPKGSTVTVQ